MNNIYQMDTEAMEHLLEVAKENNTPMVEVLRHFVTQARNNASITIAADNTVIAIENGLGMCQRKSA